MQAYSPLGGNDAGSPMKRQLLAEPELAAIAAAHAIDGTPKLCCTPPLHLAGVSIGMERGGAAAEDGFADGAGGSRPHGARDDDRLPAPGPASTFWPTRVCVVFCSVENAVWKGSHRRRILAVDALQRLRPDLRD